MNTKRINLRMVATMVACLAATTMFASCNKTNDDGGGDNVTKLLGKWSSRYFTPIKNSSRWIEFKSDGTFYYYLFVPSTSVPVSGLAYFNSLYGTFEFRGNYKVKGEKIHCTKILLSYKKWEDADSNDDYINKSFEDDVWDFYFSEYQPGTTEESREAFEHQRPDGHEWLGITSKKFPNLDNAGFQKPAN